SHDHRNCVLDGFLGQFAAIHFESAGAAFPRARAIIFEVEDKRVLARLERTGKKVFANSATDAAFPPVALQIEKVVNEDRLAFLQKEAETAETATHRRDHSFGAAFGDSNLGGNRVVLV